MNVDELIGMHKLLCEYHIISATMTLDGDSSGNIYEYIYISADEFQFGMVGNVLTNFVI